MSRKGLNIYKRKDGRWEARYIKSRTAQGKPLYGYLYASSYHEARNRLQDVIRLQGNAPNSKEMIPFQQALKSQPISVIAL